MRITVHNLGVLKEATIDLKPLTVFIGPNNSGKTWLGLCPSRYTRYLMVRENIRRHIVEQQGPSNIYSPINRSY